MKHYIKTLLPTPLVKAVTAYRRRKVLSRFGGLSSQEIFTKIYEDGMWGRSDDLRDPYVSGTGSREVAVVATYVAAVKELISTLPKCQNAVDLGCGDFTVGSLVRPIFQGYIACDIVEQVVEFNRERYRDLDVDFRIIDLTKDRLPTGDIAIVRQVLQHLSNDDVSQAIANISASFENILVTEHIPQGVFTPNLDKPTGPGIRLDMGSGLVLTKSPFFLRCVKEQVVCEVPSDGGIIRTTWYNLRSKNH
jgi:hypothetical protein